MALLRSQLRVWLFSVARLVAAVGLLAALTPPGVTPLASAAGVGCSLVVTSTADVGPGSLRDAVACATPGQTVTFSGLPSHSTISLTTGEIAFTKTLTIDGSGVTGVTVDGGSASRIFNIGASSPVTLTALVLQHGAAPTGGAVLAGAGSPLVLSQVTVLSSTAASGGGGVMAEAAVTLNGGVFQNNRCTNAGCAGGGLYTFSRLTLSATSFISNSSLSDGGAALALDSVTLSGGQFQRNTCTGLGCLGGALSTAGDLTLTNTAFLTNTSQADGGGALAGGNVTLSGGQFQSNSCAEAACQGGGLRSLGGLVLTSTVFLNNHSQGNGGGARAVSAATLTGGQFQGNTCAAGTCAGGGLYSGSALTISGTVFLTNTSQSDGGGLIVFGPLSVTNARFQGNSCTLAACQGGGLAVAGSLALTTTLVISNSSQAGAGGALAGGPTTLNGSRFEGNHCAAAGCQGGGLNVTAAVTLVDTPFLTNTSRAQGGGVFTTGAASVSGGQFQGNACGAAGCLGGGLYAGLTVELLNTTFLSNTSQLDGGAVFAGSDLTLTGGLFQGNRCVLAGCVGGGLATSGGLSASAVQVISNTSGAGGGGAVAAGAVLLSKSDFERNVCSQPGCLGGGLYTLAGGVIDSSAFVGNQAGGAGGGLAVTATAQLTLANVTLSGNTALAGGGLYAGGTGRAQLLNVTVADNIAPSGGGLWAAAAASVGVTNTLFSDNSAVTCAGQIDVAGDNFEWPGTSCAAAGPGGGFTSADPALAPLNRNSPGLTPTHALLNSSPARDAGDQATCAGPEVNNVDQRGVNRPLDSDMVPGAKCDSGAFEAGPPLWVIYEPQAHR